MFPKNSFAHAKNLQNSRGRYPNTFDRSDARLLSYQSFVSQSNSVAAMARAMAFVGIIAVGQTWLMISGELDLSVGSVAGLCAVVAAWLVKEAGCSIAVGLAGGLMTGALAGLINGFVAVRIGVPGFIATLGMLYIARGLNYLLCKGYPIYPIPDALNSFGKAEPGGTSWAFVFFSVW